MPAKLKPKLATIGLEGEEGKDFILYFERIVSVKDQVLFLSVRHGDGRGIRGRMMIRFGDGGTFTILPGFDQDEVTPFKRGPGGRVQQRHLNRKIGWG